MSISGSSFSGNTERELRLVKAQMEDFKAKGLDPERAAKIMDKLINSSKQNKYDGLVVKTGASALSTPPTPRSFKGLATGLEALDQDFFFGLREGDLVVVTGNPGLGKSSICAYMAMTISKNGDKALFYNFEDGEEEFENRLRLLAAGNGFKQDDLKNLLYYGMEQMAPFYTDPMEILYAIRGAVMAMGVKIVFVDMINDLVKVNTADQADELVRALNNLAKELKIVIVITAKMRKTQGMSVNDKLAEKYKPTAEAISGFNAIESFATKAITISRVPPSVAEYQTPEKLGDPYQEPFAIHVVKARQGNKTIDLKEAYVCQWLKYPHMTILEKKGFVPYEIK